MTPDKSLGQTHEEKVASPHRSVHAARFNSQAATRPLLIFLLTAACAGCALDPIEPSQNPNWVRVSGKQAGCVSYGPRRREPVDLNILLKPEFEASLSAQLEAAEREAHKCWYETPSGTIRLFTGDFCGYGTDTFFEQQASTWKIASAAPIFATCHPTKN